LISSASQYRGCAQSLCDQRSAGARRRFQQALQGLWLKNDWYPMIRGRLRESQRAQFPENFTIPEPNALADRSSVQQRGVA
jgi:hypothetical protein